MVWKLREKLRAYLKEESGNKFFHLEAHLSFALVYPNVYHVGMSNLGLHILYRLLNERLDTRCERVFLPEKKDLELYKRSHTPLMSLETQTPLNDFQLIGFIISFEMDYFHVLDILNTGHVKILAQERDEKEPLVLAGGPCATFNPEPLSLFVDAFIIGEGEETLTKVMDTYKMAIEKRLTKFELLQKMARLESVYVPRFYQHVYNHDGTLKAIISEQFAPKKVKRSFIEDLDKYPAHTSIVTDNAEFNLYLIETSRGCGRHCRFCMAGYCFRKPRNRSLAKLRETIKEAETFQKRIGFMGAAISDYPEIDALCASIKDYAAGFSVASLRVDSVTKALVEGLYKSGMKTLSMAPEAGSQRLRRIINKGIEEEHLFQAMDLALQEGIEYFRLYIMIGLPYEEESDIQAIVDLTLRLKTYMEEKKSKGTLLLSINPFIPKPFTPFQWLSMDTKASIEKKMRILRTGLAKKKGIELKFTSPKEALIQGVLARGDRKVAEVLYEACQLGGSKFFKKALKALSLTEDFYIHRLRRKDELFPWETLDVLVSRLYLYHELERASEERFSVPCFTGCKRCGVCIGQDKVKPK